MPKSSDVQITQLDIKESELYNPHTVQKVFIISRQDSKQQADSHVGEICSLLVLKL